MEGGDHLGGHAQYINDAGGGPMDRVEQWQLASQNASTTFAFWDEGVGHRR